MARIPRRILSYLAVISTISVQGASSSWSPWGPSDTRALYLMSNNANNSILAVSVAANGSLSGGTETSTGGAGGNLINSKGQPSVPDALSSQDSVVVAGNYLFNVNAGSGTVSMFKIDPRKPTSLTLIGTPMSTNGDFPTTLTVSLDLSTVCATNTGSPAGVSCATFNPYKLSPFDALRPLNAYQTDPPTGPIPGIGDIFFDATSSSLAVAVKGNGVNITGYMALYPVTSNGSVSYEGTQTTPAGTEVLFGSALMPWTPSKVFVSDASFGAVVLDLKNLTAPLSKTVVPGKVATCWAQVSAYGTGFITDAGVNRLVETDLYSGDILSVYYPPNENTGMTDFVIKGEYVWALSANNGSVPAVVTAFDISGGVGTVMMTQVYEVPGAGPNAMGLAVW